MAALDDLKVLGELPKESQLKVARNVSALNGRSITPNKIFPSERSVFEWKKDFNHDNHFKSVNEGEIRTVLCNSLSSRKLVTAGYSAVEANASLGITGVGGFETSVKTSESDSKTSETNSSFKSFVAEGYYPRGEIILNSECVQLTDQFKKSLASLLDGKINYSTFESRYGKIINLRMKVGGKLYSTQAVTENSQTTIAEQKHDFESKFTATASIHGMDFGAGGGVSTGSSTKSTNTSEQKVEEVSLQSIGGESTLVDSQDWTKWKESVSTTSRFWVTIDINKYANVLKLTEFMEEDEQWYNQIKNKLDSFVKEHEVELENNGKILGFNQTVSNLSGTEKRLMYETWGSVYENKKENVYAYDFGEVRVYSKTYDEGNSFMTLYGTKLLFIVGFQQEMTSSDSKKNRVIYHAWGNRNENEDKQIYLKCIGDGEAYSKEYGWGYSYYKIFTKGLSNVVGFMQECSDVHSKKPWVVTSSWGNTKEGNKIKKLSIGSGYGYSAQYGRSYSRRYLFVKQ